MSKTDFATVADTARRLGLHVRTVHRLIKRGDLDAVQAFDGLRAPYLVTLESIAAYESRQAAA